MQSYCDLDGLSAFVPVSSCACGCFVFSYLKIHVNASSSRMFATAVSTPRALALVQLVPIRVYSEY
jgi:hypothetical protein